MTSDTSVLIIGKGIVDSGWKFPDTTLQVMSIVIAQGHHLSEVMKNRYGHTGTIHSSMIPRFLEDPQSFDCKRTTYGDFLIPKQK